MITIIRVNPIEALSTIGAVFGLFLLVSITLISIRDSVNANRWRRLETIIDDRRQAELEADKETELGRTIAFLKATYNNLLTIPTV